MDAARWERGAAKWVFRGCQRRRRPLAAHSIVRALAFVFFNVQSGGQPRNILIVMKRVTRAIVSKKPLNGDSWIQASVSHRSKVSDNQRM